MIGLEGLGALAQGVWWHGIQKEHLSPWLGLGRHSVGRDYLDKRWNERGIWGKKQVPLEIDEDAVAKTVPVFLG